MPPMPWREKSTWWTYSALPSMSLKIVKDVMRLKIPYLWLQEGVCHEEAVKWAEADGILVVMDRCIYKEHARFARA